MQTRLSISLMACMLGKFCSIKCKQFQGISLSLNRLIKFHENQLHFEKVPTTQLLPMNSIKRAFNVSRSRRDQWPGLVRGKIAIFVG